MNPEEYSIFENDRAYVNPTISRDETLAFADTLKDVQAKNNAQIASQTQSLGTAVPSIQGGLGGSESYFQQRYQTIPSEVARANLRATAQAKALNDLMTNAENQYKNRYNQAYRSAKARASAGGSGTGSNDGLPANVSVTTPDGDSLYSAGSMTMSSDEGGTGISDVEGHYVKAYNANGNIVSTDDPNYAQADDGYYYNISDIAVPFALEFRFPDEASRNRWRANEARKKKYPSGGW